jgi:hypothetical protein
MRELAGVQLEIQGTAARELLTSGKQPMSGHHVAPDDHEAGKGWPPAAVVRDSDQLRHAFEKAMCLAVGADSSGAYVFMPGIVFDEERIRAALQVADAVADKPSLGPYR